jgi:hypothetical protein
MATMRNIFTSLLLLVLTATLSNAAAHLERITMTVPGSVINDGIQKALPANIPIQSQTILGSVSIDAIRNLQLQKDTFSGNITLSGHDLNMVTAIAGHKLRMKIGSLTMTFQCDASIRFDEETQTLFLKPVISEIHSNDQAKTEVASLISQLFNNREFPLELNKLKPIIGDTGDKILNISMLISNILVSPGLLQLELQPVITATSKQK